MTAFYNENDPKAARWLRNLIDGGEIAHGAVDPRSIRDIAARDVAGATQAHFFAGIGGWSHALRLAGWPDDVAVWTGSCPCQPFSAAGKRKGEADDRHLWPDFRRLIDECRPPIVFGEQVASRDGRDWLSRVRSDLEEMGYAVGCADLCAASVGAPHIRQRLYFGAIRLADPDGRTCHEGGANRREGDSRGHAQSWARSESGCRPVRPADPDGARLAGPESVRRDAERDGFWGEAERLACKDGKSRRVKPGVRLLVDGLPRTVAPILRGFGNALVPQVAYEFIKFFTAATKGLRYHVGRT